MSERGKAETQSRIYPEESGGRVKKVSRILRAATSHLDRVHIGHGGGGGGVGVWRRAVEKSQRGKVPLLSSVRVRLLYLWGSPKSDLSVIELCDNTNILSTVHNVNAQLHASGTTGS